VELLAPFTLSIAQAWCHTFQTDMFTTFEQHVKVVIQQLLTDFQQDLPPGLKGPATSHTEHCLQITKVTMKGTVDHVRKTLNKKRRELSRSMAPNIQEGLRQGYEDALKEKGKGSIARQKVRTI
jgi:hypothetical protein